MALYKPTSRIICKETSGSLPGVTLPPGGSWQCSRDTSSGHSWGGVLLASSGQGQRGCWPSQNTVSTAKTYPAPNGHCARLRNLELEGECLLLEKLKSGWSKFSKGIWEVFPLPKAYTPSSGSKRKHTILTFAQQLSGRSQRSHTDQGRHRKEHGHKAGKGAACVIKGKATNWQKDT